MVIFSGEDDKNHIGCRIDSEILIFSYLMKIAIQSSQTLSNDEYKKIVDIYNRKNILKFCLLHDLFYFLFVFVITFFILHCSAW